MRTRRIIQRVRLRWHPGGIVIWVLVVVALSGLIDSIKGSRIVGRPMRAALSEDSIDVDPERSQANVIVRFIDRRTFTPAMIPLIEEETRRFYIHPLIQDQATLDLVRNVDEPSLREAIRAHYVVERGWDPKRAARVLEPDFSSRQIIWWNVPFHVLGIIVMGVLMQRSVISGRARLRRKALAKGVCPKCGYATANLPEPRCPECGEAWPGPREGDGGLPRARSA